MQFIKWIVGIVLYYVIVHFGSGLYLSMLEKFYVEPRWLFYLLLLVLTGIAVNIVGWAAYLIARAVIYGSKDSGREYTYLIIQPWLAWNLFFLIVSIINRISGGMPRVIFWGNVTNSGCWVFLLWIITLGSVIENKKYI